MDMVQVLGVGLTAAMLAVLIKGYKPELSILISLAAAAVLFVMVIPQLRAVAAMFQSIAQQMGIDSRFIGIMLKIIGVAYLAQFGAELCKDAGESAIASKVEFAGKVIIMVMSMPVLYRLLELVNQIAGLNGG